MNVNAKCSKMYVFYHIFCNEKTPEVIQDQMNKIIYSGLYNECDKIYTFLVGNDPDHIHTCEQILNYYGNKVSVEATGLCDKTKEKFTLEKIHNYICDEDHFLYIHSKGVSRVDNKTNIMDWRNVMEYFLIYQYKKCVFELNEYDTVGINFIPNFHYSGNFWWTTGKYYKTLPLKVPGDHYTAAEDYLIKSNPNVKPREMFNTGLAGFGHYRSPYPLSNYVDL
jgi:hypothetical protein